MKFKFLQKKQIGLIALTFVVMLAVWFVKSPLTQKDKEGPTNEVNLEISIFENLREAVLEQRADEVATWDQILSDEKTIETFSYLNATMKNISEISGSVNELTNDKMMANLLYDKFVKIDEKDTIMFASPVYDGMEKSATKVFDGKIKVKNSEYEMTPYSLLIINSGIPYRIMTPEISVDYIAINFDYTQKANNGICKRTFRCNNGRKGCIKNRFGKTYRGYQTRR